MEIPSDGSLETPTTITDANYIKAVIRSMFSRTLKSSWALDKKFHNPLTRQEQVNLKIAVRRHIDNASAQDMHWPVILAVNNASGEYLTDKFEAAEDFESFFLVCFSFDNYISQVSEWFDTTLASLGLEEGNQISGELIVDAAYNYIFSVQERNIATYFFDKAHHVRDNHPYVASWAFKAAYSDRFIRVIKKFLSCQMDDTRLERFETSYVRLVTGKFKRIIDAVPRHTSLRNFLELVSAAWHQEWNLYTRIFDSPSCDKNEFKERMLDNAYFNYVLIKNYSRHARYAIEDLLSANGRHLDRELVSGLFLIISCTDEKFTAAVDVLKKSLSADARKKCFKKVEELLCEDIDAPEWSLANMMEKYWRITLSYTHRWRDAVHQTLREDQLDYIKNAFSKGVFNKIRKKKAVENIKKIGESCAEFLCGLEGPRQAGMQLESVLEFYGTVASQKSFARYVARKYVLAMNEKGMREDSLQAMFQFCERESHSAFPDELKELLRWNKEAKEISESINEGENQHAAPAFGVSGIIYPEKYMPQYVANLLRKLEELVNIDTRFADLGKAKCELREEERLAIQNAQSVLKIKTEMFGANKELILILTVNQFSVLYCVQRKRKVSVKNLCSTLKRADVSERTDEGLVKKMVKVILMSLIQPYQLVKIFSGRLKSSQEIRPSGPEEILERHYVALNKELQTGRESLWLPRPDLQESTLEEIGSDIGNNIAEQPRRANVMMQRVAQNALRSRVRARCTASGTDITNEEETISEVHERLSRHNVTIPDIRAAVDVLIERQEIERHQEGETSMLKFIGRVSE